jgi:hypothetical protein
MPIPFFLANIFRDPASNPHRREAAVRRFNEEVTLLAAVAVGTLIWFGQKPASQEALAEIVHPHSRIIVRAPIPPRPAVLPENVFAEIDDAGFLPGKLHFAEIELARHQAELAHQQAVLCDRQAKKISVMQFDPIEGSL